MGSPAKKNGKNIILYYEYYYEYYDVKFYVYFYHCKAQQLGCKKVRHASACISSWLAGKVKGSQQVLSLLPSPFTGRSKLRAAPLP
eukprot:scaffold36033_cov36-Prasinocladus_malaysianus.AAC.1